MSRAPVAPLCPRYHHAVELIGRRWNGAILSVLLGEPRRFADMIASIPDLSDRMLAERLKELEQEGIVDRTVFPETPVRIEYALTPKGRALEASIRAVGEWAEEWLEDPAAAARKSAAKPSARRATRA